jgi:mannobiose 2-epimerase
MKIRTCQEIQLGGKVKNFRTFFQKKKRRLLKRLSKTIESWKSIFFARNTIIQLIPPLSFESTQQDFIASQTVLEQILTQNILPFWYPQVVDLEKGGYRPNHDSQGKWQGQTSKHVVTQARMVWFFSKLARTKYGINEHLEAARHGYEFLRDNMWDKQGGGFFWEVDAAGEVAVKTGKHLYGQGFGLYALSEYALVSDDAEATELACQLFDLLENNAHDPQFGGYREFFQQDWQLAVENRRGYLGADSTHKLMNTHLHLMEAITVFYLLTKDSIARERLIELIFINSNATVRKTIGACTDKYQHDWKPLHGPAYGQVSYGHDLENIWLLVEACNAAGISTGPLLDLFCTLFGYALRYGFDHKKGGFYDTGSFNAPANRRDKVWWVQAEAIVSALYMYRLTRQEVYRHCFCQTLDWVVKYQVDWEHGDWYERVAPNGRQFGNKAWAWKSSYHNGRAMLQCLQILPSLA